MWAWCNFGNEPAGGIDDGMSSPCRSRIWFGIFSYDRLELWPVVEAAKCLALINIFLINVVGHLLATSKKVTHHLSWVLPMYIGVQGKKSSAFWERMSYKPSKECASIDPLNFRQSWKKSTPLFLIEPRTGGMHFERGSPGSRLVKSRLVPGFCLCSLMLDLFYPVHVRVSVNFQLPH